MLTRWTGVQLSLTPLVAAFRPNPPNADLAGRERLGFGYECDRLDRTLPVPASLVVVSDSPVVRGGRPSRCNSVYYRARSGAQVFSAGTWNWEDYLDGPRRTASVEALTASPSASGTTAISAATMR